MRRKIKHPHRRKLYPSNVPKRLFDLFRSNGYSITALAKYLKINSGHISRLLNDGIEPSDTTEKGREARKKLFLSKRKKKIKVDNVDRTIKKKPEFIIRWNHLPTDERHNVIKEYLKFKDKYI